MSFKQTGKALALAGIILVLSTLAIEKMHTSGMLTTRLVSDGNDYTQQLIQEQTPKVMAHAWDVRKYGYVLGVVGLCLILCAPGVKRQS